MRKALLTLVWVISSTSHAASTCCLEFIKRWTVPVAMADMELAPNGHLYGAFPRQPTIEYDLEGNVVNTGTGGVVYGLGSSSTQLFTSIQRTLGSTTSQILVQPLSFNGSSTSQGAGLTGQVMDVAVDESVNRQYWLMVVGGTTTSIRVNDLQGNFVRQFPLAEYSERIAVGPDHRIYVPHFGAIHAIRAYNELGVLQAHITHPDMQDPQGIDVAPDGTIFAAAGVGHRIQVFSPGGVLICHLDPIMYGTAPGQIHTGKKIAVDGAGNVFVYDRTNSMISKFHYSKAVCLTPVPTPGGCQSQNLNWNFEGSTEESSGRTPFDFAYDNDNGIYPQQYQGPASDGSAYIHGLFLKSHLVASDSLNAEMSGRSTWSIKIDLKSSSYSGLDPLWRISPDSYISITNGSITARGINGVLATPANSISGPGWKTVEVISSASGSSIKVNGTTVASNTTPIQLPYSIQEQLVPPTLDPGITLDINRITIDLGGTCITPTPTYTPTNTPTNTPTPCRTTTFWSDDFDAHVAGSAPPMWSFQAPNAAASFKVLVGSDAIRYKSIELNSGSTTQMISSISNDRMLVGRGDTVIQANTYFGPGKLLARVSGGSTGPFNGSGACTNCYVFDYSMNSANTLRKIVNGGYATDLVFTPGLSVPSNITTGTPINVRFEVVGYLLRGYVNGILVAEATDPASALPSGTIGLAAMGRAVFDDVKVNPATCATPTPTPQWCENFSSYPDNALPANWSVGGNGGVGVQNDALVFNPTPGQWLMVRPVATGSFTDAHVDATLSGGFDCELILRDDGAGNGYVFVFSPGWAFAQILKVQGGAVVINVPQVALPVGFDPSSYVLTLDAYDRGGQTYVGAYVNGIYLTGLTDPNPAPAGGIAIYNYTAPLTLDSISINGSCNGSNGGGNWLASVRPGTTPKVEAPSKSMPNGVDLLVAPNPLNGEGSVWYELPEAGQVRWQLFNMAGDPVAQDDLGAQGAGTHQASLNGTKLARGIYFLVLQSNPGFGWRVLSKTKVAIVH